MGPQGSLTPLSSRPDFVQMYFFRGEEIYSFHWISKRSHDPQTLV